MWDGECLDSWRVLSAPRPAVPDILLVQMFVLLCFGDGLSGCVPPVMRMTFPDRLGMSLLGLKVDGMVRSNVINNTDWPGYWGYEYECLETREMRNRCFKCLQGGRVDPFNTSIE